MIPALVINLDDRPERLAFQAGQLDGLGIAWERLAAITPRTLSPPAGSPYWRRWERPLRDVEKAALASHRAAWTRIAQGRAPWLVLEDDALLLRGAGDLLASAAGIDGADLITLETRGRHKRLGARHPSAPLRRLWQDRTGAAAYVLWPRGAAALVARADRAAGLADAVICAAYDLRAWQAVPALAIQADQCARWGLASPPGLESAISSVPRPDLSDLPTTKARAYRLRRLGAQARMGLRALAHPFAETVEVPPDLG